MYSRPSCRICNLRPADVNGLCADFNCLRSSLFQYLHPATSLLPVVTSSPAAKRSRVTFQLPAPQPQTTAPQPQKTAPQKRVITRPRTNIPACFASDPRMPTLEVAFRCLYPECVTETSPSRDYCDVHMPDDPAVKPRTFMADFKIQPLRNPTDIAPGPVYAEMFQAHSVSSANIALAQSSSAQEDSVEDLMANASALSSISSPCPYPGCLTKEITKNQKFCSECAKTVFHSKYVGYKIGEASADGNNCLIDSILQKLKPKLIPLVRISWSRFIRERLVTARLANPHEFLGSVVQIRAILAEIVIDPEQCVVITSHLGAENKLMHWFSFIGARSAEAKIIWLWNEGGNHFVPIRHCSEAI
jgi:hypothetical protein